MTNYRQRLMLKDKKLEINILTTSIFQSPHKVLYGIGLLLVGLFLINPTQAIVENKHQELNRQEILYKLADDDEDGEYKEGAYWIYNIGTGESAVLDKHILMDYTEAWHTTKNQYVVLDLMSIIVLDSNRAILEEKKINDEDLVIGGQYNSKLNKVFFLLRKGNSENYTIGLYEFDVTNRCITQVIDNLDLGHGGIEEPFKKMFFIADDKLLIRNYKYQFLEIDVISKAIQELVIDESQTGRLAGISQNKNGLVYLKYSGYDKLGMHYKLMQYDFRKHLKGELVKDIANIEWERKSLQLFSDSKCSSFCLQVGSKVYLYNHQVLQELPIKFAKVLAYHKGILLYQNSSSEIRAYSLNKKTLN